METLDNKSKEELIEQVRVLQQQLVNLSKPDESVSYTAEPEQRFQLALEKANLLALSINNEGIITYCNQSFIEFTG